MDKLADLSKLDRKKARNRPFSGVLKVTKWGRSFKENKLQDPKKKEKYENLAKQSMAAAVRVKSYLKAHKNSLDDVKQVD